MTRNNIISLFTGNGFGFGKYWAGYVFAKSAKDRYFLYLGDDRMAILSAAIDEDGEKTIVTTADEFTPQQLSEYFQLDYNRQSTIEWIDHTVNVLLLCNKPDTTRNNILYYMWPAVNLNFCTELCDNCIVVYDNTTDKNSLEALKETTQKNRTHKTEFWTMIKLLAIGDRFGELAPKICMETIPGIIK
ncbi:MAG: hypothetical protein LBS09_05645 [Bacteroidales bacterium]|jgi:hypothetical protein|nr:hypothetical protein [Bacteroidales bacterium]